MDTLFITAISKAVESGMKVWALYLESADKRRTSQCIDAAESFIRTYRDASLDPKIKDKRLTAYEARFFKFNQ